MAELFQACLQSNNDSSGSLAQFDIRLCIHEPGLGAQALSDAKSVDLQQWTAMLNKANLISAANLLT